MKFSTCSKERQLKIEWKCHIIEGRKHIKFAKNGTEVIEYITINQDKLTKKLYALANEIYMSPENAKHFAYVMKNYKYEPIYKQMPKINNKEILLTINKIVNELLDIDLVYWDIHSRNFLVKGKKVIVIDLDEAKIGVEPERVFSARFNYVDLIIELYIGYLLNKDIRYLNFFMDIFHIEDYFSQDVCDYLKSICLYSKEQINRDPSFLITEFEDKEKIDYLKFQVKELIKK